MTQWNIPNIVDELQQARNEWRTQRKSLKDFGGRERFCLMKHGLCLKQDMW